MHACELQGSHACLQHDCRLCCHHVPLKCQKPPLSCMLLLWLSGLSQSCISHSHMFQLTGLLEEISRHRSLAAPEWTAASW